MKDTQNGFTLIELMIVVAIVGILASVAVYMFSRSGNEAKMKAEYPIMIAEFKLKQERFYTENNTYLSTGSSESNTFPSAPAGNDTPTPLTSLPATWGQLRLAPDKSSVFCSYVAIAGDADDDTNIGSIANDFEFNSAPSTDWYYVIAECDTDGKGGTNARYFATSTSDEIFRQNEGQ